MAEAVLIPIADVETEGLIRRPRAARVHVIAAAMASEGQLTPIEVAPLRREGERQLYRLTKGWVRLEALRDVLHRTEVLAVVRKSTVAERRRREIDDNLLGDGCTTLDRARYLAASKVIYEQDHPGTGHGGDRRGSRDQVAEAGHLIGFHVWASRTYGAAERSIRRDCTIGERLHVAAAEVLAPSEWAEDQSALEKIARLEPSMQLRVAEYLTRDPDPVTTVDEAIRMVLGVPETTPDEYKHFNTSFDHYKRMGLRQRREYLLMLADDNHLPPDIEIILKPTV